MQGKFALVKSRYILIDIFAYLDIHKTLEIISYNKIIQEKLEISIDDYKKESGKYVIGERNGKGKEYDIRKNKLIFEGEYLNGKKNGKGKQYDEDKLIFEGEYLNGKKYGRGIAYNNNGQVIYEGNYVNNNFLKKNVYIQHKDGKLCIDKNVIKETHRCI